MSFLPDWKLEIDSLKVEVKSLKEQLLFQKKCTMIYEALIDKQYVGYLDGYQDLITDWIRTWWSEEKLSWEKANFIVTKGLQPTLYKIKPMGNSLGVCPKCGHHYKI
jgi:hypothetical protein